MTFNDSALTTFKQTSNCFDDWASMTQHWCRSITIIYLGRGQVGASGGQVGGKWYIHTHLPPLVYCNVSIGCYCQHRWRSMAQHATSEWPTAQGLAYDITLYCMLLLLLYLLYILSNLYHYYIMIHTYIYVYIYIYILWYVILFYTMLYCIVLYYNILLY